MDRSFAVEITGMDHHTLQGSIHTREGAVPFRSELELLSKLEQMLAAGEDKTWGRKEEGDRR